VAVASEEPTEPPAAEADDATAPPEGVFGNLPKARPGARSARRDQPAARPRRAAAAAEAGQAKRAAADPEPPTRAGEPPPPDPEARGGGIEDVAWAGVAAAAEAATIGVRLATRALEAMRDAVDRR
jgi:hypothetical protein